MTYEVLLISPNGWVPNNLDLPVLIYRDVLAGDLDALATGFESLFQANGWTPKWRDTVFDYHHYHSTTHEALGVAAGHAVLVLGGPGGREVAVTAGDALLLPVGTGHCRATSSCDFLVVGAYPDGHDWDICRAPPSPSAIKRMATLPVPDCDPVEGARGHLIRCREALAAAVPSALDRA